MLIKKTKLFIISFTLIATLAAPFCSTNTVLADDQQPILIQIYDTDIGTEAFEKLVSYGNGGHALLGAILGNAQNMQQNPGIGLGIGSGGNGYRPSVTIAVWTNGPFDQSIGLATIKNYFNVSSNPVITNGDCAISCDGTTQVQQIIATTTTVPSTTTIPIVVITTTTIATTTTLPQIVVETEIVQSTIINQQPPTTTTTTIVENVNIASAYASSVLIEKLITPIANTKIFNKFKKTIRKKTPATVKKTKQNSCYR